MIFLMKVRSNYLLRNEKAMMSLQKSHREDKGMEEKGLSDVWPLENGETPHPPAHREGAFTLDEGS